MQSVSAEANCYGLLRFLGWMQKTNQVPAGATLDIDFLARADLGTKAQQWAQWLQQTQQIRFTSICNYLSSLVSMANYVSPTITHPRFRSHGVGVGGCCEALGRSQCAGSQPARCLGPTVSFYLCIDT